jgi:drug/metabolite transporter (DMT)-like permease
MRLARSRPASATLGEGRDSVFVATPPSIFPNGPVKPLLGIALKIVSTLAFVAMSTQIKLVGDGYPLGQVVFFRAFFALVPLLVWLSWQGELVEVVRTSKPSRHIRRCVAGTFGMFAGFAGLTRLPLPDATAIGYAAPLITTALAALVLKERVRGYRWAAVGVGFAGMIIMLSPHLSGVDDFADLGSGPALGALACLTGAFFAGVASIEVRKLAKMRERTGAIVFYFSIVTSFAAFLTVFLGWKMPTTPDLLMMVGSGIMGGVGQILLTASFKHADASVIAPFDYTSLLWALAVGFLLFGDVPAPQVFIGAGLVIAAGIFVIWRERRLGIKLRQERESGHHRPL